MAGCLLSYSHSVEDEVSVSVFWHSVYTDGLQSLTLHGGKRWPRSKLLVHGPPRGSSDRILGTHECGWPNSYSFICHRASTVTEISFSCEYEQQVTAALAVPVTLSPIKITDIFIIFFVADIVISFCSLLLWHYGSDIAAARSCHLMHWYKSMCILLSDMLF